MKGAMSSIKYSIKKGSCLHFPDNDYGLSPIQTFVQYTFRHQLMSRSAPSVYVHCSKIRATSLLTICIIISVGLLFYPCTANV